MNPAQFEVLKNGVAAWNDWRKRNPDVPVDLSGANLRGLNLRNADLRGCNLQKLKAGGTYERMGVNLLGARLDGADLTSADLRSAVLRHASLNGAVLVGANLTNANLYNVSLIGADMHHVDLWASSLFKCRIDNASVTEARLRGTSIIQSTMRGCNISGSLVYGCSVWDTDLTDAIQMDLVITPSFEKQQWRGVSDADVRVTVDNLEVAQFVYLLMHNEKIRGVIDTIGQKGVLILGRFTTERKYVLDALRTRLRELGFVPFLFDFDRAQHRDFTETVKILAGLSRFIIADITNPRSSPLELQATVPDYMVPLVPIIEEGEEPFAMFRDLKYKYNDWVLDLLRYDSPENLVSALDKAIVRPALERSQMLVQRRAASLNSRHVRDYM